MPPSAPPPETAAERASEARSVLARLDEIERRWRDALSLVLADQPGAAAHEVEAAGAALQELGSLDAVAERIEPSALAEFADRMERLTRLHHELTNASRNAQATVGRSLGETRRGRTALRAYGGEVDPSHSCDRTG